MKKHIQEEMFNCIEQWKSSKQTQKAFCVESGISYYAFKYWMHKYKSVNNIDRPSGKNTKSNTFIPITVSNASVVVTKQIEIVFVNGIRLICPTDIDFKKLKILLGV